MKFSNFFTFIHTPSRTPIGTGIAVGALAAIGAATLSGFAMFGVALGAAMLTFGVLRARNILYKNRQEYPWKDSHSAADKAGRAAAKSYINYGKSFLNMNAWRHPIRFGASMHNQMKSDRAQNISHRSFR